MESKPELYEIYGLVADSWWRSPQAMIWYGVVVAVIVGVLFVWYRRRRRAASVHRPYEVEALARLEAWKKQCEQSFANVSLASMYGTMIADFKYYLEVRHGLKGRSMTDHEMVRSFMEMARESGAMRAFMSRAVSARFAGKVVPQKEVIEDIVFVSGLMRELLTFQATQGKRTS